MCLHTGVSLDCKLNILFKLRLVFLSRYSVEKTSWRGGGGGGGGGGADENIDQGDQ